MKFCVIAAALLSACGSDDTTPAPAGAVPRVVTVDQPIVLGGIVEGSFKGGTGDAVRIVLSAPAVFDWNLHTHVGGTQVIEMESGVMAADYMYTPTEASMWNLTLLDTGSAPVTVHVELSLYGSMTWSGF